MLRVVRGTFYCFNCFQGRVLYDVILYHRGDQHVMVECDSGVVGDIVKHLRRYALRSDVSVTTEAAGNPCQNLMFKTLTLLYQAFLSPIGRLSSL